MLDVFAVAEVLVSHAVENYGEDIDLIGYYGSHARGEARAGSDLDIFYTPRNGRNPPIGRTFLLAGLLFDFWMIRWETLAGFATGTIRGWAFAPALVQQAKTLYVRSPEQATHLAQLKQQSLHLQKAECRPHMIRRSVDAFRNVVAQLAKLRGAAATSALADVRCAGWQVIESTWECLALANQVFFDRGLRNGLRDSGKFCHRPPNLEQLIVDISRSPDRRQVLRAAEELACATRHILHELQNTLPARATVGQAFQRAYPEIKDMIGKLLSACERGDRVAASIGTYHLQLDVTRMLSSTSCGPGDTDFNLYGEMASRYRDLGLPDLMKFSSGSLQELADQAMILDDRLRCWLRKHSVDLCEFGTVDELRNSL